MLLINWVCKAETKTDSTQPLKISPNKCVALDYGQSCYQDVTLSWKQELAGDYCVFSSQQTEALKCWKNNKNSIFSIPIATKTNVTFSLVNSANKNILAKTTLKMTWVYKTKNRRRLSWRLF